MGHRNIRVEYDLADAAVGYVWTDEEPRGESTNAFGTPDFGVFATFGEAQAAALRALRLERDRWREAIAHHRTRTVRDVAERAR